MQLQKFNTGTANVRHLLQSFTQAYDGLPSCVINVIGVATKADPQFILTLNWMSFYFTNTSHKPTALKSMHRYRFKPSQTLTNHLDSILMILMH